MPSVPQTSVVFFALLVGFVVFITVRGELYSYLKVLGLEGAGAAGASSGSTGGTGVSVGPGGVTLNYPGQVQV